MEAPLPTTLIEAIRYFEDPDVANDFVAALRWPDGPVCPRCEGREYSFLTTRRLWKCKQCKRQYSVKVGTIFEDSPIPLDKWLTAIWLIANAKNGVSSHELGRSIGLSQKSSWFVLHRIRLAMQTGSFDKFDGEVEIDETFIGGKVSNMPRSRRKRQAVGGGSVGKTVVAGARERGGDVRASVVPDRTAMTLTKYVNENVERGSTVYTDAHRAYVVLRDDFDHSSTNHELGEYVRGRVHTNGIENFWSVLKRGIKGTYVSIAPWHLFRYLDERTFTFNMRDLSDLGRFTLVLQQAAGRRLTWDELTSR